MPCIAHELGHCGAHVVIASRKEAPLIQTCKEMTELGYSCSWVTMNIRDEAMIDTVVAGIIKQYGALDILVNNAGGQFLSPAEAISPKGWKAVIDTNLNGTFFVTRSCFLQYMQDHGGRVVTIVADFRNGFPYMSHTGASRAAVANLTKTLCCEWAKYGVRINALAPGLIYSSGMNNYPAEALSTIRQSAIGNPSGRAGTEGEVASATVFLLSPGKTGCLWTLFSPSALSWLSVTFCLFFLRCATIPSCASFLHV